MLEGTFVAAGATAQRTDQLSVACTAVNHSMKASSLLQCFQYRKWRTFPNQAPVERHGIQVWHQLEIMDEQISNGH